MVDLVEKAETMSVRKPIFLLLLIIGTLTCHAQNLVPNPSFEQYTKCPTWDSNSKSANYYTRKNHVEYFNECAETREALDAEQKSAVRSVSVPTNYRGFQHARTGKGYIGMIFYSPAKDIDHCYGDSYTTRLSSPLVAKTKYRVSFYVSLAVSSQYGITNMGIQFYSDMNNKGEAIPGFVYYSELYRTGPPIIDTVKWTKVSFEYTANGYEDFITIGSLTKNISCVKKDLKSHYRTRYAYYFIDDFCVSKIKDDGACDCGDEIRKDSTNENQLVIQANKNITLNNVFFNSDKSELLPASFFELDKLVKYLKTNSTSKIEISGYTDNTGIAEKNLALSKARAKAVADYLISKGISATRVSYKGYGSANPVVDNSTEENKKKNRRVEFKIVNK